MNNKQDNSIQRLDYLKKIYFFNSMSENALIKILHLCNEISYEKDSILFLEGVSGDSFFVVLEGELEIWKRYGTNESVLLGECGPGHPLGEMALIDECPRSATVRARTTVRLLEIQAADFNNLLLTDTSICVSVLRSVTKMVRRSNEAHMSDLDRQNKELGQAYSELQALQDELVSRERLSVLGRFSSLILHDIKNPLSALKTRVELLNQNKDNLEYFDQAINKIQADISRMEHLTGEFLDYSRGEIRLNMSVCSLDKLLERLRDTISIKTEAAGLTFQINNSVIQPLILDEERMLRALINACENACKAMTLGGTLTVNSFIHEESLCFDVIDSGVGIPADILEHIFDPFFSVSSAGGTGLGMVIIKSIVEAHKGSVSVISTEGEGTRLSIILPLLV